jgi:lipoate-protein ligase A
VIRLARVSPERELAVVASLAQRPGSCALVIAELTGVGAALGRFQREGSSGAKLELRRLSGGRSTRYGDGIVSLCALAPSPQAWLDEPGVLTGARLLNRLVRGVLTGLSRLGLAASYPGRDFVTANQRRLAYVSLSRETSGVLLFQAVLGVGAAYTTEEREPRFPGLPVPPAATSLARERLPLPTFESIASALCSGFADRFSLALDESPLTSDEERAFEAAEIPPLVDATLAGLRCAGSVGTPIGDLEAHVALDAGGRLARVRLQGDWIAAQAELAELEARLVGELPGSARVRELCAAWLANPASLVVGITGASALADAIARSARAYSTSAAGSSSA